MEVTCCKCYLVTMKGDSTPVFTYVCLCPPSDNTQTFTPYKMSLKYIVHLRLHEDLLSLCLSPFALSLSVNKKTNPGVESALFCPCAQ